jgi:tetratricopeptide (TPR) repeat protein
MWTYLVLFLSLSLILAVFIRRLVIHFRLKKGVEEESKVLKKEIVEEAIPEKKQRLSGSDKDKVLTLCKRGVALVEAGKDDEAVKCFVQALALDNAHQETKHRLALLYFQKQLFSSAAALFKELGESTNDPVHFSHLGLALYKQNDFPSAKDAYQRAVSMDDKRPQRFVSLAQVYRAMGQCNNAIITLKKALELEEKNLDFLFLLADLHLEAGQLDHCAVVIGALDEVSPEDVDVKSLKKELKKMKAAEEEVKKP